jgi:hypothetical protein
MEPNPDLNAAASSRCEHLRWKGVFLGDDAPQADSICWCLLTQIGIGPDGQLVDRYECNPARACYREF